MRFDKRERARDDLARACVVVEHVEGVLSVRMVHQFEWRVRGECFAHERVTVP